MTRARSGRPDFAVNAENAELIAEICRRLDGLPLAIELAAARLRMLSLEAIHARLDDSLALLTSGHRDAPDRQRTLRAAITWSVDMLDEAEPGHPRSPRAVRQRFRSPGGNGGVRRRLRGAGRGAAREQSAHGRRPA